MVSAFYELSSSASIQKFTPHILNKISKYKQLFLIFYAFFHGLGLKNCLIVAWSIQLRVNRIFGY